MANEWGEIQLSRIAKLRSGFPFKSSSWVDDGVPVIKIANVKDGRIVADGCGYVSHETAATVREWMTQKGDVLIAMTGYVGEIALVRSGEKYLINQRVGRFDFLDDSPVIPEFFFYYLRQSEVRSLLETMARGSAQPNLSASDAAKLCVPVPPVAEQRAIAHILGTLDDKIELNRKQNKTLEAMARTLFKAWFVDFEPVRAKMEGRWQRDESLPGLPAHLYDLFPDRLADSDLGEVPEGWRVGPLQELLVLQRGFDLPTQSRIEGQFPVIAAGGINGTHHEAMVKGPGVVTGRSGVLGNVFLELGDYWPLNTTLWVKEFLAAKPCYAYQLLSCIDFKMFNAGSAVPTLNRNHIHVVPQIIPSSEVIGKFEDMAMVLHQGIVANNRESRSLAELRGTLLPKLISGELRVPDAERVTRGLS